MVVLVAVIEKVRIIVNHGLTARGSHGVDSHTCPCLVSLSLCLLNLCSLCNPPFDSSTRLYLCISRLCKGIPERKTNRVKEREKERKKKDTEKIQKRAEKKGEAGNCEC